MKSTHVINKRQRTSQFLTHGVAVAAVMGSASLASAVALVDGNSVLIVDSSSSSGANVWTVDDQDQLLTQWFWYRVGGVGAGTQEYSIDTLSPAVVSGGGDSATIAYSGALFDVSVTYTLAGGSWGSGNALLNEDILIKNTSGAALDLQFFQYSDFDLGGTKGDDNVILSPANSPFELAYQWDSTVGLSEGIVTVNPYASRGDTGLAPNIYNDLQDGGITDLSTTTSGLPLGPDDVEFAFQWDLSLASSGPDSEVLISKIKSLTLTPVPEPTTAVLSLLGLALLAVRRTRRS
jgi:MYXO-CTERM domain-containing protein